jgi:hypothetical protein
MYRTIMDCVLQKNGYFAFIIIAPLAYEQLGKLNFQIFIAFHL